MAADLYYTFRVSATAHSDSGATQITTDTSSMYIQNELFGSDIIAR